MPLRSIRSSRTSETPSTTISLCFAEIRVPPEAVPFVASVLLAILGAVASWAVGKRAPDLVRALDERARQGATPFEFEKPDNTTQADTAATLATARVFVRPRHLTPDGVGVICVWVADCAQSGIALVGPPIAALLLVKNNTALLGLSYIAVGVVGAIAFFAALLFARPDKYARRTKFGRTMVGAGAITINAIMAIVVSIAAT